MLKTVLCDSRARWLEERRNSVGASEIASVIGLGYQSALDVYADKIGAPKKEPEPEAKERMELGLLQEDTIRRAYHHFYGEVVDQDEPYTIHRRDDQPDAHVTTDGYVTGAGKRILWEAKCVSGERAIEAEAGPLIDHRCQVMLGMGILDLSEAIVCYLANGNRIFRHFIQRDDGYIEYLFIQARAFMESVRARRPPLETASSSEALRRIYPTADGSEILLPASVIPLIAEAQEAGRQIGELVAKKDSARAAIEALMGKAAVGIVEGTTIRVTLKNEVTKAYSVAEQNKRKLRLPILKRD